MVILKQLLFYKKMGTKKIRHSWIGWNGRNPTVAARCVKCGVAREITGTNGAKYYVDNVQQNSIPSCTSLNF